MVIRLLNWLVDYWAMLNYVIYKFYGKREKMPEISAFLYSSALVWFNFLSSFFLIDSAFNCQWLSKVMDSTYYKFLFVFSAILIDVLNYLSLYYKGKWKDVFDQFDKKSDTNEFKYKKKNVKKYIYGSVIFLIVSVIIAGLHYGTISF